MTLIHREKRDFSAQTSSQHTGQKVLGWGVWCPESALAGGGQRCLRILFIFSKKHKSLLIKKKWLFPSYQSLHVGTDGGPELGLSQNLCDPVETL